jgi:hypothetical protein
MKHGDTGNQSIVTAQEVPLPQTFRPRLAALIVGLLFMAAFCALPLWTMFPIGGGFVTLFLVAFLALPVAVLGWLIFELAAWAAVGPRVTLVDSLGLSRGRGGKMKQLFAWNELELWHREVRGEHSTRSWHFKTAHRSFTIREIQVAVPSADLFELAVEAASGKHRPK